MPACALLVVTVYTLSVPSAAHVIGGAGVYRVSAARGTLERRVLCTSTVSVSFDCNHGWKAYKRFNTVYNYDGQRRHAQ